MWGYVGSLVLTMAAGGFVYWIVLAGTGSHLWATHMAGVTGVIGGFTTAHQWRRQDDSTDCD
jgi:hypothetical protein